MNNLTFNDYMMHAANCLVYKTKQYCQLIEGGFKDDNLMLQIVALGLYMQALTLEGSCGYLSDDELASVTKGLNEICKNPILWTLTRSELIAKEFPTDAVLIESSSST